MTVLSFPSSTSSGTRYISPNGGMYVYDGYSWVSNGQDINPSPWNNTFLYRTIYTRGYMHCGYQNSSLWRNTNRTIHASDTTVNLGDMMDNVANYMDGGFSDFNTYVFDDSGSFQGSSTFVSSMNMITESLRTHNNNWNMSVSRQDLKCLMNPGLTAIYATGGGNSSTDKLCTVTDTQIGGIGNSGNSGGTVGGLSGFYGQYYGIVGSNGTSGSLNFSTETWATGTWSWSSNTDGQPKGLSSKWGLGYNSNGSYAGTSTYYKFNDTTGSNISSFGRPESCGEENCEIGQDWGYTIGSYNGSAQTNNSTKTYYTTDSCVALGSNGQPKGHGGASSGCCGTGSCTLLGGVMGTSI